MKITEKQAVANIASAERWMQRLPNDRLPLTGVPVRRADRRTAGRVPRGAVLMDTATWSTPGWSTSAPGWSTVRPLPLPPPKPRPLLELRPGFSSRLGDTVAIGFDDAMRQARQRATDRGHRQVVTRCYDDATRIATPTLARFWCIQDWR